MSKFVKIQTELHDKVLIKRALDELEIAYTENEHYVHPWGGFRGEVPLLIKHLGLSFGLRIAPSGAYELIGDDMQMARIRKVLGQIQQRYAYHMVLAETEKVGFNLVEEKVGGDNVIRLTVRRWR